MAIPVTKFQVWDAKLVRFYLKDECLQKKLQYLLKWNDGRVVKNVKFWFLTSDSEIFQEKYVLLKNCGWIFFTKHTIFIIGTFHIRLKKFIL